MSPSQSRVRLNALPRNMCGCVLNNMKDGDSTTCLGSLFQCLTPHKAKKKLFLKQNLIFQVGLPVGKDAFTLEIM